MQYSCSHLPPLQLPEWPTTVTASCILCTYRIYYVHNLNGCVLELYTSYFTLCHCVEDSALDNLYASPLECWVPHNPYWAPLLLIGMASKCVVHTHLTTITLSNLNMHNIIYHWCLSCMFVLPGYQGMLSLKVNQESSSVNILSEFTYITSKYLYSISLFSDK